MLHNHLQDGIMLFLIFNLKQHLVDIWRSFIKSSSRRLLCNNHENTCFISILLRHWNRADRLLNDVDRNVASFLYLNADKNVPCCTLVILTMQRIGCLFKKTYVSFFYSKVQTSALYIMYIFFIFIRSAIIMRQ